MILVPGPGKIYRNLGYYILVTLMVAASLWGWGYVSLYNSDEYVFAQNFLRQNRVVLENVGAIGSMRPGLINFKRSYSAGAWVTYFDVVIDGQAAEGSASFKLKSVDAKWIVEEGVLNMKDGRTIRLL